MANVSSHSLAHGAALVGCCSRSPYALQRKTTTQSPSLTSSELCKALALEGPQLRDRYQCLAILAVDDGSDAWVMVVDMATFQGQEDLFWAGSGAKTGSIKCLSCKYSDLSPSPK